MLAASQRWSAPLDNVQRKVLSASGLASLQTLRDLVGGRPSLVANSPLSGKPCMVFFNTGVDPTLCALVLC